MFTSEARFFYEQNPCAEATANPPFIFVEHLNWRYIKGHMHKMVYSKIVKFIIWDIIVVLLIFVEKHNVNGELHPEDKSPST